MKMKKQKMNQDSLPVSRGVTRRHFVKITGIAVVGVSSFGLRDFYAKGVSVIIDSGDRIAKSQPSLWAIKELERSLTSKGIEVYRCDQIAQAKEGDLCIFIGGSASSIVQKTLKASKIEFPDSPEALGLIPCKISGKPVLIACGFDERGLVYALLELADRVNNSSQPLVSIDLEKPVVERPANTIRSLNRLFVSDIEDKPWYNDKEMWPQYLTMLATNRFNRFNLSLGIGYDFLQNVTDGYFLLAYPFF